MTTNSPQAPSFRAGSRTLSLVLDIGSGDVERRAATGRGEIGGRPQDPVPVAPLSTVSTQRPPRIGWVKLRGWRDLPGAQRSLTVSRKAGRWFVSVLCRIEAQDPQASTLPAIGIDRGVATAIATSDGRLLAGPNAYAAAQDRLAFLQRALARKMKGSSNGRKLKKKIAALHARVAAVRLDWLHKASTTIAKNHGAVVLEDLRTRAMSESAKGSVKAPGSNVAAKSGINRSILDQGWGIFRALLDYKLADRTLIGALALVNPACTSQTCSCRRHKAADNRLRQDLFSCVACGHTEHADINAAKNILRQGMPSTPVEGGGCAPGEAGTILEIAA